MAADSARNAPSAAIFGELLQEVAVLHLHQQQWGQRVGQEGETGQGGVGMGAGRLRRCGSGRNGTYAGAYLVLQASPPLLSLSSDLCQLHSWPRSKKTQYGVGDLNRGKGSNYPFPSEATYPPALDTIRSFWAWLQWRGGWVKDRIEQNINQSTACKEGKCRLRLRYGWDRVHILLLPAMILIRVSPHPPRMLFTERKKEEARQSQECAQSHV